MFKLALIGSLAFAAHASTDWKHEWTSEELNGLTEDGLREMFDAWKNEFAREYTDTEEPEKYDVWRTNLFDKIAVYNSRDLTFKLALNDFADMTDEQFKEAYHCLPRSDKRSAFRAGPDTKIHVIRSTSTLPQSVDWTTQGVVTPVKNQGQCGSCWAFSATGSMECQYAIKTGTLNSLSEQQLVDCSGSYGNYGCSGGWYYSAWEYAEHDGGLCTEAEYPYTARNGECKDSTCGMKYNDPSGYQRVTPDSDMSLATASAAGCVSVAIQADQTAFQYYSSGVLTGTCGTSIDHAVLVVGYGTMSGQEYWKVKNSWGTSWGEQGYVYICRNCNKNGNAGECGINLYPYTVTE